MISIIDLIQSVGDAAKPIVDAFGIAEKAMGVFSKNKGEADVELRIKLSEILDHLDEAKRKQFRLEEQLLAFQREQKERDEFAQDLERYSITQTNRGATVYANNDHDQQFGQPSYICPKCVGDHIRSFLQPRSEGRECYYCPNCDKTYEADLPDYGHDDGPSEYDFPAGLT